MKIKGLPVAASYKASVLAGLLKITIDTAKKLKAGEIIDVTSIGDTPPTVVLYEVIESKPAPVKQVSKEKT